MIKHTYIATIVAAVLCAGAMELNAREQDRRIPIPPRGTVYIPPRPVGNFRELTKTATLQVSLQREVEGFVAKLAEGSEYTQQFDAAASAKDKKRLMALIREAGVRTGEVTIGEIAERKISVTIKLKRIEITIGFEW